MAAALPIMAASSAPSVGCGKSSRGASGVAKADNVSDLLANFAGRFDDWLPAVLEKASVGLGERCEASVKCAQVNCWQVLASRKLAICATSGRRPRLNQDVIREICAFLGPLAGSRERVLEADGTARLADEARARDRLRVADYLIRLLNSEAAKGSAVFLITREVLDAAPKSENGARMDLGVICQYLSEECGYRIKDARDILAIFENEHDLYRFRRPRLPLKVALHVRAAETGTLVDAAKMATLRRTGSLATTPAALLHSSPEEVTPPRDHARHPLPRAKVFVDAINAGVARGVEYVVGLAQDAFQKGMPEFLLTEELWKGCPKLASGQLPPFWPEDVEALVPEVHLPGTFLHHVREEVCRVQGIVVQCDLEEIQDEEQEVEDDEVGVLERERFPLRICPDLCACPY